MNNSIFLNPLFQGWLIALIVIPLFSFLAWKELKRKLKFLAFRIVALLFILVSLLGLLFRPGFVKEIRSSGLILLTPGYEDDQIDSLLKVQPGLVVVHLPATYPYHNSRPLNSYQELADLDHEILFIVGEGLPSYALELMDVKKFQFVGSRVPVGVVQLRLPETSSVNQRNEVSGLVNTTAQAKLTLVGPGGKEDSIVVNKKGVTSFSLRFKPREAGPYLYQLQYQDESGIQLDQLPVLAKDDEKLHILFLQKFPTFEVRQLKNFLAEHGHQLALRYQVSKNNYRFEFANISSIRTSPLTSSVLQQFDLVVVDGDGLESLTAAEKKSLEESLMSGIGLIILSTNPSERDKVRDRFLPVELKRSTKDTVYFKISARPYLLPVVPLQLTSNPSLYPVTKKNDRILSVYTYNGFGKVGLQLLQETYRIALEGNMDDYAAIWSPLVEKTARKRNDLTKIKLNSAFPYYEDEPLSLEFISTQESLVARNDQEELPLIEHVTVDNLWLGQSWAGQPGWHQVSADSAVMDYFVSEPGAWSTLRIANQLKQNEMTSLRKSQASQPDIFYQRRQISLVIFYLLFLAGAAFLWLAPKI